MSPSSIKPPPLPGEKKPPSSPPSGTGTPGTSGTPRRAPGDGPAPRAPRAAATPKLQKSLEELFSAPALIYSLKGDQWAAEFVAERGPVMAKAWADLANENPAVRRVLMKLTEGSAWGGVIIATGGTALPLLAHHGMLPPSLSGAFGGASEATGPIVPPPPAQEGPPPRGRRATPPEDMTAPLRNGQPPGVVTVAGTNNGARN